MALRKVKNPSGETKWEVRLRVDGRNGREMRRRFDSRRDAEAFIDDFKAQVRDQEKTGFTVGAMDQLTFAEEAEYWLQATEFKFSEGHKKRVKGILAEILPKYGRLAVGRITPPLLVKFQSSQMMAGKSANTVNRKTEVITAILNNSLKHRRIPYNPSAGFSKLRKKPIEMGFWEKHEAIDFLRCMNELHPKGSGTRWRYVVYLLALNTGMRAGEIWGLMPKDFSRDGHSIYVVRQYNRVTKSFGTTKGKNHRHVPLNETLKSELLDLIEKNQIGHEEPVFKSKEGAAKNHDSFVHRYLEDLEKWGGRKIRFHDMRHTATTLMLAAGTDLKTVKEVCGHKDVSTTMNYIHLLGESVAKLSRSFNLNPLSEEEESKEVIPFKRKI